MSQAFATTTTPPVPVMWSGTLPLLMTVTIAPTMMGLPATLGQHDVVLLPLLMLRDTRDDAGLTTVPQQQPQSKMLHQAYARYAIGPLQVHFSFTVEPPSDLLNVLKSVLVYAFRYHAGCHIHQWGLNHWVLNHCSLLEHTHGRHMCSLVMFISPC